MLRNDRRGGIERNDFKTNLTTSNTAGLADKEQLISRRVKINFLLQPFTVYVTA